MKYAIIIPDGCADEPLEALGGKTPLQAARTPHMDEIARRGVVGEASHVPAHLEPGSAVANMSLLGYDPVANYTGRAPLEAAAQSIQLGPDDWAIRCNLVTIQDQIMKSFTADHITTAEATELLAAAQEALGGEHLRFYPGVSYRNLLIWRGAARPAPFSDDTRTTQPHDLTDKSVLDDYPRGPGSEILAELMSRSIDVFAGRPVNLARVNKGKLPATNIWLWGQGKAPNLPPFAQTYGRRGLMITAVDLLRGIARLIGWQVREAPGATGYLDTDYASKGRTAIAALPDTDIVCVHVEATDEASHEGRVDAKIAALEEIDRHIVGPLHAALQAQGAYRILVTPDHPTPIRLKTHSHGAVPFALCGAGVKAGGQTTYDEVAAAASGLRFDPGWQAMRYFLGS